jgi:hypothetical protein
VAIGNPLPVTRDGNLLPADRVRIHFVDVSADALDVVALHRAVGEGIRGLVSMVGHAPAPLVMKRHATLADGGSRSPRGDVAGTTVTDRNADKWCARPVRNTSGARRARIPAEATHSSGGPPPHGREVPSKRSWTR